MVIIHVFILPIRNQFDLFSLLCIFIDTMHWLKKSKIGAIPVPVTQMAKMTIVV